MIPILFLPAGIVTVTIVYVIVTAKNTTRIITAWENAFSIPEQE